jgi:hypothetical protein
MATFIRLKNPDGSALLQNLEQLRRVISTKDGGVQVWWSGQANPNFVFAGESAAKFLVAFEHVVALHDAY